ncbi:MAG: class I SAM-dependent methyltransferase [Cyanobacteria bacterium P01_F01_bin.150]
MDEMTNICEPSAIKGISHDTEAHGFGMCSNTLVCSFLRTLVASKPNGKFLELGSGTGLSTAWILDGMSRNAQLTTIDNTPDLLNILRAHLGLDNQLTVVCADGDEYIHELKGKQFDLIFADTWPGKYRLLPETLDLLNPGGLYIIDDMLHQPNWPEGHEEKVSALITFLESSPGFKITKMAWASGVIVATKV